MSTLPAASSFNGSADSLGTIGRTSKPTELKYPCAIAVYSDAWSALGNQSSITVNGFVPDVETTSCLVPHAPSAMAQTQATSRDHPWRGAGLPPSRGPSRAVWRTLDDALNGSLLLVDWPTARAFARRWSVHKNS